MVDDNIDDNEVPQNEKITSIALIQERKSTIAREEEHVKVWYV